jgi:NADH:ubiquinone oxidoreductase subunit 6 (subunit J)
MSTKLIGIVLIIIGAIMMLYTGFNYVTTETLVDLGPVSIESEKNNFMKLSPILGAILLAGGLILLFLQSKKSNT